MEASCEPLRYFRCRRQGLSFHFSLCDNKRAAYRNICNRDLPAFKFTICGHCEAITLLKMFCLPECEEQEGIKFQVWARKARSRQGDVHGAGEAGLLTVPQMKWVLR
jgi:hypothetical protein